MSNSNRAEEIAQIAPEFQPIWLATQVDEVEHETASALIALKDEMNDLKKIMIGLLVSITLSSLTIAAAIIVSN